MFQQLQCDAHYLLQVRIPYHNQPESQFPSVTKIIDLQIANLNRRLEHQQLTCVLTDAAKAAIVEAAYDPQYGARPLRRYVQHTVETLLSRKILRGEVLPGQTITVDAMDGEIFLA